MPMRVLSRNSDLLKSHSGCWVHTRVWASKCKTHQSGIINMINQETMVVVVNGVAVKVIIFNMKLFQTFREGKYHVNHMSITDF